ncbi:MAG: hypothetical protein M1829_004533 [Trizodia sp. TS-e1964]|nr:MAG: hypothetical protein M1829_004533 [Trizodia sp. TS-e1964]
MLSPSRRLGALSLLLLLPLSALATPTIGPPDDSTTIRNVLLNGFAQVRASIQATDPGRLTRPPPARPASQGYYGPPPVNTYMLVSHGQTNHYAYLDLVEVPLSDATPMPAILQGSVSELDFLQSQSHETLFAGLSAPKNVEWLVESRSVYGLKVEGWVADEPAFTRFWQKFEIPNDGRKPRGQQAYAEFMRQLGELGLEAGWVPLI